MSTENQMSAEPTPKSTAVYVEELQRETAALREQLAAERADHADTQASP